MERGGIISNCSTNVAVMGDFVHVGTCTEVLSLSFSLMWEGGVSGTVQGTDVRIQRSQKVGREGDTRGRVTLAVCTRGSLDLRSCNSRDLESSYGGVLCRDGVVESSLQYMIRGAQKDVRV